MPGHRLSFIEWNKRNGNYVNDYYKSTNKTECIVFHWCVQRTHSPLPSSLSQRSGAETKSFHPQSLPALRINCVQFNFHLFAETKPEAEQTLCMLRYLLSLGDCDGRNYKKLIPNTFCLQSACARANRSFIEYKSMNDPHRKSLHGC